jgi:hypothetical protein
MGIYIQCKEETHTSVVKKKKAPEITDLPDAGVYMQDVCTYAPKCASVHMHDTGLRRYAHTAPEGFPGSLPF